jgi:uncharacterized protein YbjT (DUF2867 family)
MPSSEQPVLVYAGTGQQGRALVHTLRTTGRSVRVLTRDPSRAHDLAGPGVELVEGGLGEPDSLRAASEGAGAVVLTVPLLFDRDRMTRYAFNAVEAAEAAGGPLLVYNTSLIPPDEPGTVGVFHALQDATERVLDADLDAVVLRPPLYLDNLLAPWTRPALDDGVLAYPLRADLTVPWISHRNLARYVAAALDRRGPVGTVLDVAGPDRLSLHDLADTLSRALGRTFEVDALPPDRFGERVGAALGAGAGEALAGLYRAINAQPNPFFDRDFERARAQLDPDLEPTAAWAQRVLATAQAS